MKKHQFLAMLAGAMVLAGLSVYGLRETMTYFPYVTTGSLVGLKYSPTDKEEEASKQVPADQIKLFLSVKDQIDKLQIVEADRFLNSANTAKILNSVGAYVDPQHVSQGTIAGILGDLHMFRGPDGSVTGSLFEKLNYTETLAGELVLASMLSHPLRDRDQLAKRQSLIRYLHENPSVVEQLTKFVSSFKAYEAKLINGLSMSPELTTAMKQRVWRGFFGTLMRNFQDAQVVLLSGVASAGVIVWPGYVFSSTLLPRFVVVGFMAAVTIYDLRERMVAHRLAHSFAIAAGNLVFDVKKLNSVISTDENLASLKHVNLQHSLLHEKEKFAPEFMKVYQEIFKNPRRYQGKPRYNVIIQPMVNTFYKLKEVADGFAPMLEAIGEIDAYLSIVRLMQKHQDLPATFSFAEFDFEATQPLLEAENVWLPILDPMTVVMNSVSIGKDERGQILTGSNTGGKSTFLRSVLANVHLAQTITIVPSSRYRANVYSRVLTGMSIVDDVTKGVSLYQSEVNRAETIMSLIKEMSSDEFALTILDELFTGTSPKEGIEAAMLVTKWLLSNPNTKTIFSTHFKEITTLEQIPELRVRNFKMEANINGSDFTRLFKYVPGISSAESHTAGLIFDKMFGQFK